MRDWLHLFEEVDPRCREVSVYILNADADERRETLMDILQTARLDGWAGKCFAAAVAINRALFGGEGELVVAHNGPMAARGQFLGHAAVRYDGEIWDADGKPKTEEDVTSWGMLDSQDPDYDLTDEEAEQVVFEVLTEADLLKLGGDPTAFENTIYASVAKCFEFDDA
jgi:hypothetical protein